MTAAAPGSGKPTGTVSFYDGRTLLGTATLSNGRASIKTTALAIGASSVTVVYGGDGNFQGTTSAALTITVNQDTTTTKLSSSSSTAKHGTPVTFTANGAAGGAGLGHADGYGIVLGRLHAPGHGKPQWRRGPADVHLHRHW